MNVDDPETRIAELERQLTKARTAGHEQPVLQPVQFWAEHALDKPHNRDEQAPARPVGLTNVEIHRLREAFAVAVARAGMSPEQLNDALPSIR
jgi:hypothetical protein